jgi:D-alanyl-lipoteichoic acid acyltransferase DltB (MBOAT superfamily)
MRDYIFYPLLLSPTFQRFSQKLRRSTNSAVVHKIPVAIATFVVFMAVGIWHGAAWRWVAYALFNATVIAGSVMLEPLYNKLHEATRVEKDSAGYILFMRVRTVLIRSISLTFSRALSLTQAFSMIGSIFTGFSFAVFADGSLLDHGIDVRDYAILACAVAVVWWVSLLQERGVDVTDRLTRKSLLTRWTIYIGVIVVITLLSPDSNAGEVNFIYGRF